MSRTLSREQARAFYDRFGRGQDIQAWFDNKAMEDLLVHADLEQASDVLEFGSGTGRFADRLLASHLSPTCRFTALELSETMVALTRKRLEPWSDRVSVLQTDGSPQLAQTDDSIDRVLSTYVLDLLSVEDIAALLAEFHRVLVPGTGLLCLVGMTEGEGAVERGVCWLWNKVHALSPSLVGGCRPLRMRDLLPDESWDVQCHEVHSDFGFCSEVLVAKPVAGELG